MLFARRSEAIVFELALAIFGGFPAGGQPAFAFQAMKRGVKRTVFDLKNLVGGALDVLRDLMSMGGSEEQGAQDEHVEGALKQGVTTDGFFGHGGRHSGIDWVGRVGILPWSVVVGPTGRGACDTLGHRA